MKKFTWQILLLGVLIAAPVAYRYQNNADKDAFKFLAPTMLVLPGGSLLESVGNENIFQAGIMICNVCWLLTYVSTIKLGFERQTCGMPFIALAGNVAWEFIFSFIKTDESTLLQTTCHIATLMLDLVNVYLFLSYGRRTMCSKLPMKFRPKPSIVEFYSGCVGAFLLAFWILFSIENIYVCTWWQNLVMSLSFLFFIPTRLLEDQSRAAAYLKMIGTFIGGAVTILYRSNSFTPGEYNLFVALASSTSILDVVYIWLLEREYYENRRQTKTTNFQAVINGLACFVSFAIFGFSRFGLSYTQMERELIAVQYTHGAGNATSPENDVSNPCVFL